MPIETEVLSVGDGNCVFSYGNGELVVQDLGWGSGKSIGVREAVLDKLTTILKEKKIRTVDTVISHQHKDHYNMLPVVSEAIKNVRNENIRIGRVIVGGKYGKKEELNKQLCEFANVAEKTINVEFVTGGEQQGVKQDINTQTYSYGQNGDITLIDQKTKPAKDSRIYFSPQEEKGDREYLKFLVPNKAYDSIGNGNNDKNLVNMLVSKHYNSDPIAGSSEKTTEKLVNWGGMPALPCKMP